MLENRGILVVFSPPQTASVDAYSFDSRLRPVVILNPIKRDYYRQRFDVAHELGHLVMHSDAEPGGRIVAERMSLAQSATSTHLATLRDGGLLTSRREWKTVYYRADPGRIGRALADLQVSLRACCPPGDGSPTGCG
ncbi:ImmA/IrrE family metallo-endopeptidase [Sphaerisporangium perillae]|uniref:ImmA/IrrE family metallo-endopeptidase n=1 Tax=Sphaerisporangium perillae TaxID=2935860 RepID=UPI00200CFF7F|nr:ImmA/IrrE family metallo-endopeptidase [Sphaerisporangium perillae]